jgi:exopolyphosphatase/guanosine-5'-triphosphate,3'-diphosphate pyrophosphatase
MRIAALDLGSNSFHLLVADVHPDRSFTTVTREKDMLRLGDEVGRHGRVREPAADRAVASVRRLYELALANGARDVLAVATAAVRAASNGSELIDRLEREAGVHVRVIDGLEEARLVYEAVRASVVIEPAPAVCLDLGGGSLEILVGDQERLFVATSERLGVGLLTSRFIDGDPPPKRALRALEAHVRAVLEPVAVTLAGHRPRMLIGTSGTLGDLAAMAYAHRHERAPTSRNQLTVPRDDFRALHERLVRMTAQERRRLDGLEDKRVDLVVAGSVLLDVAFDVFDQHALTFSDWALREGMLLDAFSRHDPDEYSDDPHTLRQASVRSLARRCNSNERHCRHVLALALALFDDLRELHGLGATDREMLEHAVLLHDIGQHVSHARHHEHAAYLVRHGALRGFEPEAVGFLAALVRHHRRGEPKASEELFGALDPGAQERVRRLAAILRLADGLDRGRRQRVFRVTAHDTGSAVLVRIAAEGDPELEVWGARRRRDLFEKVFARDVEIVHHPAGARMP